MRGSLRRSKPGAVFSPAEDPLIVGDGAGRVFVGSDRAHMPKAPGVVAQTLGHKSGRRGALVVAAMTDRSAASLPPADDLAVDRQGAGVPTPGCHAHETGAAEFDACGREQLCQLIRRLRVVHVGIEDRRVLVRGDAVDVVVAADEAREVEPRGAALLVDQIAVFGAHALVLRVVRVAVLGYPAGQLSGKGATRLPPSAAELAAQSCIYDS